MPALAAVSCVDFPHRTSQQAVRDFAKELFAPTLPEIDRMLPVFDNTQIERRNLCEPIGYYAQPHTFEAQNREYVRLALAYGVEAAEACAASAGIDPQRITDLIFISSTGLATPSLDALMIDRMRLNPHANRMAIFGLGCAGGVSGFAKACTLAQANPQAAVLLVTVELCSLTFLRNDFSKSNFVGSSLFSDGAAACLIVGDRFEGAGVRKIRYIASESRLYYGTQEIMGWDFTDKGFKVVFSPGIPALIAAHVREDASSFLAKHGLKLSDIRHFIFHPGGRKVLGAYEEALGIDGELLSTTRGVMRDYGNMSSATVLYVLERFVQRHEAGYGLMMAMGPGFSSETVVLEFTC